MSLWEDGRNLFLPSSPFAQAQPDPGTDPSVGPYVCVQFNQDWLPLVCGALSTLVQPQVWGETGSTDPTGVLARATTLVNLFGLASACPVNLFGIQPVTIPAGSASMASLILFAPAFASVPRVDISWDNDEVIVQWGEVAKTGFFVTAKCAVVTNADIDVNVEWSATYP